MTQPLNPNMAATFASPVSEARRWLAATPPNPDRPIFNLSQAAPVLPPPLGLRQALADAALQEDEAHLYGPVLGLTDLRAEVAVQSSALYGGNITPVQVGITSGCNQAFCAAISTLAAAEDEVILPSPWYFNHKMWLDMQGIRTIPLLTGDSLIPDPDQAAALITPRTKAILLVTPNNPGGVEYPPATLRAFLALARSHGIALVVDETYRDFHSQPGAPHDLFSDPDWSDTLIHLYSFSKAYRMTGHRVGAIVTSQARMAEVEKFLDTVTICPSSLAQRGALWGMRNLGQWLAGERAEILDRRAAVITGFTRLSGWRLLGCGAYFAYAEHPFAQSSEDFARHLVARAGVLLLPGSMFTPIGDAGGTRQLRIAFANADRAGINTLIDRLTDVQQPRR